MSDFLVADHGSIIAIVPLTAAASKCLDANIATEPWQWLGGALCVDHRYSRGLTDAIAAEGFDLGI